MSAGDVFELVEAVVGCLREWRGGDSKAKFDILIKNAEQTLINPRR